METRNKYQGRMGMRRKSHTAYMKDVQMDTESRTISGYAAVFNNVDKAGDMLIRGCFSKSISERGPESAANDKIIFLWQHRSDQPIGRITRLVEDEKGLYFEAEIDRIEEGDRAIAQLESGTLNQFSIGFSYVWENCEWDNDVFIVKEVKLYEVSVVTFGCNPETEYLGLKSAEERDRAYESLAGKIRGLSRKMDIRGQRMLQEIVTEAVSLSSFRPNPKDSPAGREAGGRKSVLYNLKTR